MRGAGRDILVWDAFTRLFHWLVAALVVAAYASWKFDWMRWMRSWWP